VEQATKATMEKALEVLHKASDTETSPNPKPVSG
jgi:hypothetical protein